MDRKSHHVHPGFVFGAFLIASLLMPPLHRVAAATKAASDATSGTMATMQSRNANAFAQILGELRMGAADILFIKTERYLHAGVAYAPHLDTGKMDRQGVLAREEESSEHENHGDHSHGAHHEEHSEPEGALTIESLSGDVREQTIGELGGEVAEQGLRGSSAVFEEGHEGHDGEPEIVQTVIRTEARDFRGFLGNLEREIKPWIDPDQPHVLTGGSELLPWCRLMTLSNPHFIRGYRIGGMWLSMEGRAEAALEFLDEGIGNNRANPELYQLHLSKTMIYVRLAQRGEEQYYDLALDSAEVGFQAAVEIRPELGEVDTVRSGLFWTIDHEEDFLFLVRFNVMLRERKQEFGRALAFARDAATLAPDDAVLLRLIDRLERGESPYAAAQAAL